jgi:hypothetical protein
MKNHSLRLISFVCMFIFCSLSCATIHSPSQFLNRFSLGETIKRMNLEEIDVSSVSALSTAAARNPSSHRRDFDVTIVIKEPKTESFDERHFLLKLKERIVQEARDSGVTVYGMGEGGDTFHVDYQNKKHQGGIEVIGVRMEKDKYRVWCIIRELA